MKFSKQLSPNEVRVTAEYILLFIHTSVEHYVCFPVGIFQCSSLKEENNGTSESGVKQKPQSKATSN